MDKMPKAPQEIRILFASVGRRVELVEAFRLALARLGAPFRLMATDMGLYAPALYAVTDSLLAPPLAHPDYVAWLLTLCGRHEVDLLVPSLEEEVPLLAPHATRFAAAGTRLLCASPEAVRIAHDKWAAYQWLRSIGLAVPETTLWTPGDPLPSVPVPVYVKPREGSGTQGHVLARNADDLAQALRAAKGDLLLQEVLGPPEVTTDLLCGFDGRVYGIVPRHRLKVRGGEVVVAVTVQGEALIAAGWRIAAMLPIKGPFCVQCMTASDGTWRFTDLNPRFGGGVPLAFAAGIDYPYYLLRELRGDPVPPEDVPPFWYGMVMMRADQSVFVSTSWLRRVERFGREGDLP